VWWHLWTDENKHHNREEKERSMDKPNRRADKSTWAIGGGVLLGVGAGFFFLRESPLFFVACILIGIGLGLLVTAIISRVGE
jgi:hypothetical protein